MYIFKYKQYCTHWIKLYKTLCVMFNNCWPTLLYLVRASCCHGDKVVIFIPPPAVFVTAFLLKQYTAFCLQLQEMLLSINISLFEINCFSAHMLLFTKVYYRLSALSTWTMCAAKSSFKRIVKSRKLKKFASLCSEESLDQEYKCVQRGRSAEQLTKLNCSGDNNKNEVVQVS